MELGTKTKESEATMNAKGCFLTLVCLVLLVFLGFGLAVVSGLVRSQTAVTTSVAGRKVTVTSSGTLNGIAVSSDGRKTRITVNGQEVRIDADQVDVVGVTTVPIPRDCREIELRGSGRRVRVFFDGKEAPR